MNFRALSVLILIVACSMANGCMRVATAPLRAERAEKAEKALDRLAQVPPETLAALMNHRMSERLSLTADQVPKVEAINLASANRLHAIANSGASLWSKGRDLRQEASTKTDELKSILTAEQMTRYEAMREELREAIEQVR